MALFLSKLKLRQILKTPVRYKHNKDHWSVLKKRKTAKDKALEHFDEFYASVYGDSWIDIRTALLSEQCKYMAVVNNFSDTERIKSDLESLGAIHLQGLYDSQKKNMHRFKTGKKQRNKDLQNTKDSVEVEQFEDQAPDIQKICPEYPNLLEALKTKDTQPVNIAARIPVKLESIDQDLTEVNLDVGRIIDPSVNLASLHEYVPATKIKGLDNWVLESDHYKFYDQAGDFKIEIEKENDLPFPEHLHAYTFERGNNSKFPSPKKGSTGVLDYYLFDGGSILPVLALNIQLGDVVLDMCAAPGGKALTILQTLVPRSLVANDLTQSRMRKLRNVVNEFISDIYNTENMLFLTEQDAKTIDEKDTYNKILVDVPCTTDRHILNSDDNNIFKPSRLKERVQMPDVQSKILTNALRLVKVGGTVVYATCSLSPIQNDGVVHVAAKRAYEENNAVVVIKDMTEALLPLKYLYEFGNINLKYGHIVIPTVQNNWGPMYFCKIVRVQ